MKSLTLAAMAAGLLALGACHSTPADNAAENVRDMTDNQADNLDAMASNTSNDAVSGNLSNTADAVRDRGENHADAIENGTAPINGM